MTLLALSPEMKFIARGVVLVLVVWMDVARLSRARLPAPNAASLRIRRCVD